MAEALDRGWDPESIKHDQMAPEPLTPEWQTMIEAAITTAKHLAQEEDDYRCGTRCDRCDERMCAIDGPEPRACGVTCADCPCSCLACLEAQAELRAEVAEQIERDSR